jgi:hypothetical protein
MRTWIKYHVLAVLTAVATVQADYYIVTASSVDLYDSENAIKARLRRDHLIEAEPRPGNREWLFIMRGNLRLIARRQHFRKGTDIEDDLRARRLEAEVRITQLEWDVSRATQQIQDRLLALDKLRFDDELQFSIPSVQQVTYFSVIERTTAGQQDANGPIVIQSPTRQGHGSARKKLKAAYHKQPKISQPTRHLQRKLQQRIEQVEAEQTELQEQLGKSRRKAAQAAWKLELIRLRVDHYWEGGDDVLPKIFYASQAIPTADNGTPRLDIAAGTVFVANRLSADGKRGYISQRTREVSFLTKRAKRIQNLLLEKLSKTVRAQHGADTLSLQIDVATAQKTQLQDQCRSLQNATEHRKRGLIINQVAEDTEDNIYGIAEITDKRGRQRLIRKIQRDVTELDERLAALKKQRKSQQKTQADLSSELEALQLQVTKVLGVEVKQQ